MPVPRAEVASLYLAKTSTEVITVNYGWCNVITLSIRCSYRYSGARVWFSDNFDCIALCQLSSFAISND